MGQVNLARFWPIFSSTKGSKTKRNHSILWYSKIDRYLWGCGTFRPYKPLQNTSCARSAWGKYINPPSTMLYPNFIRLIDKKHWLNHETPPGRSSVLREEACDRTAAMRYGTSILNSRSTRRRFDTPTQDWLKLIGRTGWLLPDVRMYSEGVNEYRKHISSSPR